MYCCQLDRNDDVADVFGRMCNFEQGRFRRSPGTSAEDPAWYCARTKPKHEHIAAANASRHLGLEVFLPRLRAKRFTQRGIMHVVEPVFPCYVFVRCVLEDQLSDIRYMAGISSLVRFGDRIPVVPDAAVRELQACFDAEEPMSLVDDRLARGASVVLADGVFAGMSARVLRALPARRRVRVLLEILGRAIPVEVDRSSVMPERDCVMDRMPLLALAHQEMLRA